MRWIRNPFFKPVPAPAPAPDPDTDPDQDPAGLPPPPTDSDLEAGTGTGTDRPSSSPLRPASTAATTPDDDTTLTPHTLQRPTSSLTTHQFFYLFIIDGLGAMVLSGAINFAVAYAMYTTATAPIRLWQLPNTLAGDAAVTILLQSVITWLVELVLVNRDLARGGVAPLGFVPPPPAGWRAARWFLFLDRQAGNSSAADAGGSYTLRHWAAFFASQVVRALLVGVACFVVVWGPAVGILTAVGTRSGGDWVFERTWAPQVFKLVLGGVLALLTTPAFAGFWMVRAGWALRTNEGL